MSRWVLLGLMDGPVKPGVPAIAGMRLKHSVQEREPNDKAELG
jgi:hypothetical protein